MQALLSELNSIPNTGLFHHYITDSKIVQNASYENKKRRFIKILQSVNPNFKIQFTKNNILQILVDDNILVEVNLYSKYEKEGFLIKLKLP